MKRRQVVKNTSVSGIFVLPSPGLTAPVFDFVGAKVIYFVYIRYFILDGAGRNKGDGQPALLEPAFILPGVWLQSIFGYKLFEASHKCRRQHLFLQSFPGSLQ